TAAAFAAGLVVHSGIALIPSVIAGASLYLFMAASYLMISRQTKATPVTTRLQELEEALEIIDSDLQRIDRVEEDVARLALLTHPVGRGVVSVPSRPPHESRRAPRPDRQHHWHRRSRRERLPRCRTRRRLRASSC